MYTSHVFQSLGGKDQLLAEFPTIKEQVADTHISYDRTNSDYGVLC